MDIGIDFFNSAFLLKGLNKDSLKICEIFLDVKIKDGIFVQTPKIQRQ